MSRRRLVGIALVAVIGAASLAACGGGKDNGTVLRRPSISTATSTPVADAVIGPASDDEAAALAAFEAYKAAILAKDGATAAGHLSETTISYYGELLDASLHWTELQLDELPVLDVVVVLLARARYPVDRLAPLTGRTFLELAVNDGLIDESTVSGLSFDRAVVNGDHARLTTSAPGQALRGLDVQREQDAWKVDLVPLIRDVSQLLDSAADEQGQSHTAAALELVKRREPTASPALFKPLRSAPPAG